MLRDFVCQNCQLVCDPLLDWQPMQLVQSCTNPEGFPAMWNIQLNHRKIEQLSKGLRRKRILNNNNNKLTKTYNTLYLLFDTSRQIYNLKVFKSLSVKPYLYPFSTTYIFFSKNHQSLISLCITSSLESTSCLISPALH